MSRSIYNGGLVGEITPEGRPRIADDGNWSLQGNPSGEGPAWRSILLIVNGSEAFGYRPAGQREPYAQATSREGVFTRANLLGWLGPVLAPGAKVEMILVGGDRYLGWGDTAGEDWMEWGSQNPTDASKTVLATTGILTVPGSPEPPPDQPQEPPPPISDEWVIEVEEMVANVEVEMSLATSKDPEKWITQNPKEAADILRIVVYRAFDKPYTPAQLKSHRGRAASGIAQNGVTCQDGA